MVIAFEAEREQSFEVKGRLKYLARLKCSTFNDQTFAEDESHFVLLVFLISSPAQRTFHNILENYIFMR